MSIKVASSRALLACAWLLGGECAGAQDDAALLRDGLFARDRNVSVTERPKPEYDPPLVRIGAFFFDPVLTAGLAYDDDIYATKADRAGDAIGRITASLSATSDWPRNEVSAFARISSAGYVDHTGEDTTDYAVGAATRLDAQRDLGFAAGAGYARETEPRTAEAFPAEAARPIQYSVADAWVETTRASGRLRLTAKGWGSNVNYDDARTAAGLLLYDQDRDHIETGGTLKAEYAYLPDTSFFISLDGDRREYRDAALGELLRSSSGYKASVGANFDFARLARGEFAFGYLEQDYDSRAFRSFNGLAFRGQVQYFPTQLTTVTLEGSRTVQDSGLYDVGGYLADAASLKIDHELLRNLVLSATLSYAQDDYSPYGRVDRIAKGGFAATYLLNRSASLSVYYTHWSQDSRGVFPGPSYDIDRLLGTLSLHL